MTATDYSPWRSIVGPCRDTAGVARLLGLTEVEVEAAGESGRLLRATTEDGADVYPDFQFTGERVVAGLSEVLGALRSGINDPWTWAGWLNADVPGRGRHIDALRAGRLAEVLEAAQHDAASWVS